jgi:VWFA-related protein
MKRISLLFLWTGLVLAPLLPQRPSPEAKRGPVPVALRVFDGGRFVGDLTLQDFELFENGVPQILEALYRVEKNAIARRDGERDFLPFVGRRFYFLFQLFEYHPKIADAVRYLFDEELRFGDSLEIQTPVRNYKLSDQAFAAKPMKALAEEMTELIKKDINQGSMAYNSLMRELKQHIRAIGGSNTMGGVEIDAETDEVGLELLLPRYREIVQKLDTLRRIDSNQMVLFAQALKKQPGQKLLFFVYQREFRPEINPQVISEILSNNQEKFNVLGDVQELFQTYQRGFAMDVPSMKEAFADSGTNFNLLFMNKDPERIGRIVMREQNMDIFRAFADIAAATGGTVDTSQNPAVAFKNALKTSDEYYLLYFTPSTPAASGVFRPLSVKVKGKDYQVVHRSGYFGN